MSHRDSFPEERRSAMSIKRKDHKGRILRTGERQRKDLIYQYRYTDCRGKRQTIYDADLQTLRKKAKEIQNQMDDLHPHRQDLFEILR